MIIYGTVYFADANRYFADLQFLLNRFQVINENERKQAAVKYLKIRTEQLWTTTRAWANQAATFDEFKTEVFQLYPGASADRTWSIQDLDLLIGQTSRVGILTTADLGEYYRQFLLISRYLISMNHLSTHEQSRSFFRGLQPSLEARVRQHLQLKFLNHLPDDPYNIAAVYEAVSYVLMGSAAMGMVQVPLIRCAAAIRVKARRCCVYWVREALSRSVRRSRSARARCQTRFRRTKSTDAERNLSRKLPLSSRADLSSRWTMIEMKG